MKKLFILPVLFISMLLCACSKDDDKSSTTVDPSDFDDTSAVYLSDFDKDNLPKYDTWIINDSEADSKDFAGLVEAICSLADSNREISLVFPHLKTIPDYAIFGMDQGEYLFDEDYEIWYYEYIIDYSLYDSSAVVSISAPEATEIENFAFSFCFNLREIDFPKVTKVGEAVFVFSKLSTVGEEQLPVVEELGSDVFSHITTLKSATLPLVTDLGDKAFYLCSALSEVEAPLVQSIGESAFSGCSSLTSVDFPEAQIALYGAFNSCLKLTSASLPKATYFGKWAFYSCTSLESVEIPEAAFVGSQAFYSCSKLTEMDLPQATMIGMGTFYSCTSLKQINLPLAESIGSEAFRNCDALTSISLPELSIIDSELFYKCSSLEKVELAKASQIEINAFNGCTALSSLTLSDETKLSSVAINAFLETNTEDIDLHLGFANKSLVSGRRLTVGGFSASFKSISLF